MPHRLTTLMILLALLLAPARAIHAQSVIIAELSAQSEAVEDEDGHDPDWLELLNISDQPQPLAGWYLTDDDRNLTRWQLPDVTLVPGARLLIFASGKDRRDPSAPLHTNFELSSDGETLLLVRPDGVTIEHAVEFPAMAMGTSFGVGQSGVAPLVGENAEARWRVPTNTSLGTQWLAADFNDSSWNIDPQPFGFFQAPVEATAGELYVDLRASSLTLGRLSNWPNSGSLSNFTASGTARPEVQVIDGVRAVRFANNRWMKTSSLAPADITGNSDWSVEVWVYDPQIGDEECIVNWGHRNGPASTAAQVNMGTNAVWGAVTHWDAEGDMGYIGGAPAAGVWHHIVVTYTGGPQGEERVYVDGELNNMEVKALNIHGEHNNQAMPIILAGATGGYGASATPDTKWFDGAIAILRMHGGALTPEQVRNNYYAQRQELGLGDAPEADVETDLSDVMGGRAGVYLRYPFTFDGDLTELDGMLMDVCYDDGFVAYLNGVKVAERNTPVNPVYNSRATVDRQVPLHELQAEEINLTEAIQHLRAGENVLAVHVMNSLAGGHDLFFDVRLRAFATDYDTTWFLDRATPGQPNGHLVPGIFDVQHTPEQPREGESVVITARVQDPTGIDAVVLRYQVVLPGHYIPAYLPLDMQTYRNNPWTENSPNPAFEDPANWTVVTMRDDGVAPDRIAGDGVWSVELPAFDNRTLLRYRVFATAGSGAVGRAPHPDDPRLNYAFFVYNGVPDYVADVRSDSGMVPRVYSSEMLTALPTYHLITRQEDIMQCHAYNQSEQIGTGENAAWTTARRKYNWWGTLVYDGRVYDHVKYRLRGGLQRYNKNGKRSLKIRFNSGDLLQARDIFGDPYPEPWRTLELGKMHGGRGDHNWGLSEQVNMELFRLYGVPSPFAHWSHLRVIDGEAEQENQYEGDFWGLYWTAEYYDVRYLRAHELPLGNLYKLTPWISDPLLQMRYHAPGAVYDGSDYRNYLQGMFQAQTEEWLREHNDFDYWYRYHAITDVIKHWDLLPGTDSFSTKNMAWYFHPVPGHPYGKAWILPYDTDASWGPNYNEGIDPAMFAIYRAANHTQLQLEYRNHLREVRDLLFTPEVINVMIEEYASVIRDFVEADIDRWKYHPQRALGDLPTLQWKIDDMRRFAWEGGSWNGGTVPAGGQAALVDQLANAGGDATSIPDTPTITYVGPDGFPINGLRFQSSPFSDPQGANTFAAMQWRVGEIDPDTVYDPDSWVQTLVPAGSTWRYRKGTSAPSQPLSAWRQLAFNDAGWSQGQAPIGYGETFIATTLSDMRNNYTSFFMRHKFQVDDPSAFYRLRLDVRYDDGANVWINGRLVFSQNMSGEDVAHDALATGLRDVNEGGWVTALIDADVLQPGENVIAMQVQNLYLRESSDAFGDVRLLGEEGSEDGLPRFRLRKDKPYEIQAVWQSEVLTEFTPEIQVPGAYLEPGRTYRARVRHMDNTGRWSHWSEPVQFSPTGSSPAEDLVAYLRVSELMFAPQGNTDMEYIEFHNISQTTPIIFRGDETFTSGITFTFPAGTRIEPLGHLLLVRDTSPGFASFRSFWGVPDDVPIIGPYSGRFANDGERVELARGDGQLLVAFEYGVGRGWWPQTDEAGHSLVPISLAHQPLEMLSYGYNWRPSTYIGGSPGRFDPYPLTDLMLTEVAPNTDTGEPAPFDSNDWFEIVNMSGEPVELHDWWVSDNRDQLRKVRLGATVAVLQPGERYVFTEREHFNNPPGSGFGLSRSGEQLFLSYLPDERPGEWRIADAVRWEGVENVNAPTAMTWGRTPDWGRWWTATEPTPGAPFLRRKPDVRITEVMYHTADDNDAFEYIELHNPTGTPIDLFHPVLGPWRIEDGISKLLPPGLTLQPDEPLLIVNFDPENTALRAQFEGEYGAVECRMVGPFDVGRLSNMGERIALERPDGTDPFGLDPAWVIVDEVVYFDQAPWTTLADGTGNSLQLVDPGMPGSDPANWMPATPTPGRGFDEVRVTLISYSAGPAGESAARPATFVAIFDRPVVGFRPEAIRVTNGFVNLTTFDYDQTGTHYTFEVIPIRRGEVSIAILGGSVKEENGEMYNAPSSEFSYVFVGEGYESSADPFWWTEYLPEDVRPSREALLERAAWADVDDDDLD